MIVYKLGDATRPTIEGPKIIAHVCNDLGLWGAGFVMALSQRWKAPEAQYKAWARGNAQVFGLGHVQFVKVEDNIWVANMVAQRGVVNGNNKKPLQNAALKDCLYSVADTAWGAEATVHMPRIGCGLAGGNWETDVLPLIKAANFEKDVYVYDFK